MSDQARPGGDTRDAFGRPIGDHPQPPRSTAAAVPGPAPSGPGRPPKPRHRGGWVCAALGLALLVTGVVLLVGGISEAVRSHDRIEDDAVGRGTVRASDASPASFVVPAGGRRDYTVYLRTAGGGSDGDDPVVAATSCEATLPNEDRTRFSGARQGVSVTLGSLASVGHFSSSPGRVRVRCVLGSTVRSTAFRSDAAEFFVTPGRPSFTGSGILAIIGGVFAILAGIGITGAGIVWAVVRR